MFMKFALIDSTIVEVIMIIIASLLSGLSLLKSILFLIHLRSPYGWMVWFPNLAARALSPYWAVMGIVGALIGWSYQALWAVPMGIVGAGTMIWYVWRCTRIHKDFEHAFGADYQAKHIPRLPRIGNG